MDRGSSVYQDLFYIAYIVLTNVAIMAALLFGLIFLMAHYGYKSVTIKLNKKNKLIKALKNHQKSKETNYISRLENNLKDKPSKKKAKH